MKTEGLAQNSGRLWNYGIARSDRVGEYLVSCALCIIISRVDPVFAILTKTLSLSNTKGENLVQPVRGPEGPGR